MTPTRGALVEVRTDRGLRLARVIHAIWPTFKRRACSDSNAVVRIRDDGEWSRPCYVRHAAIVHVYRGPTMTKDIGLPHVRPVTRKIYQRRK